MSTTADHIAIVARIQADDRDSLGELFNMFARGLRMMLSVRLRPAGNQADIEDCVHEILLTSWEQIRAGQLREPACLPGYLHTMAARTCSRFHKQVRMSVDIGPSETEWLFLDERTPESIALHEEKLALTREAINRLIPRDREIITRFYLHGHNRAQISADMGLTETQFRLYKNRAKDKVIRYARANRKLRNLIENTRDDDLAA